MAEIVKMSDVQSEIILRNVRKTNINREQDRKLRQQTMDEERVMSGKFNSIKGFDKLRVG